MADIYKAKALVVKVSVGPADGNTVAAIVRQGEIIPEGVEQDKLDALVKRGLIEKVKQPSTAAKAKADADAAAKAKTEAEAAAKAEADAAAKLAAGK